MYYYDTLLNETEYKMEVRNHFSSNFPTWYRVLISEKQEEVILEFIF